MNLYRWFVGSCFILGTYGFVYHKHTNRHRVEYPHDKEIPEKDELFSSPVGAKLFVDMLMKNADTNGDGFIDSDELYRWNLQNLKAFSLEECEDIFEEMDSDKDGQVTWKEETMDTFEQLGDGSSDVMENINGMASDNKLFSLADRNGDGGLDIVEYDYYLHPEEYSVMVPLLIEDALAVKDTNRNGVIEFEEFLDGLVDDNKLFLQEKAKFEDQLDKNRDGVLSSDEILSWSISNNM